MVSEFTVNEKNKEVMMPDGTHIGTIAEVQNGSATVVTDESDGITEVIRSALGWQNSQDNELRPEDVAEITRHEVTLRDE